MLGSRCRTSDNETDVLGRHLFPDAQAKDLSIRFTQATESGESLVVLLVPDDDYVGRGGCTYRVIATDLAGQGESSPSCPATILDQPEGNAVEPRQGVVWVK